MENVARHARSLAVFMNESSFIYSDEQLVTTYISYMHTIVIRVTLFTGSTSAIICACYHHTNEL